MRRKLSSTPGHMINSFGHQIIALLTIVTRVRDFGYNQLNLTNNIGFHFTILL